MSERRPLGDILVESGRITPDDVTRVLEYQRTHGGFFGQALVSLGVVSREEIDWALANQFDLPFIFPNAAAVDREAAHLVPPDWALAHLAVPIVRAGNVITVVVADPLDSATIAELRARTGCDVEMALASAARIRELIHAVYDASHAERLDEDAAMSVAGFIDEALHEGADRFGISVRGSGAIAWWRIRRQTRRAPLHDDWAEALDELLQPSPIEQARTAADRRDSVAKWRTELSHHGEPVQLDAQLLLGSGGWELLLETVEKAVTVAPAAIALPPAIATELRLLFRGGTARVGVGSERPDVARSLLPHLPALALGEHVRAAHITTDSAASGAGYTLRAEPGDAFPGTVAAYELDALTIDLPVEGYAVRALLRAAPLTFMLLDEPRERAAPGDWGINWILTTSGQPGSYAWDLRALHR